MNYSNPYLKNDQEKVLFSNNVRDPDVIKNLLLELEKSGRISRDSEELAMRKLGIMDSHELWRLVEEKRKENIIGGEEEQKVNPPNMNHINISSPNWDQNINTPPGSGRSGYANVEYQNKIDTKLLHDLGGGVKRFEEKPVESAKRKKEEVISPPFIMGTPFWKLKSKLPEGAYEWALSLQTNMEKVDEKLSSTRGGFQSVATNDFNQIPQNIRDHIQSIFQEFPKFQFTTWWVNINNKGNYNIAHTHGGDSDLAVVWYLTDNQSSLIFHNPFSCARHNLNLAIPTTYQNDVEIDARVGDFIIFPADVLHSVEQNKFDTPRISLSFNMSFEVN